MDFVPNQSVNLITFCKSFHAVILVLRDPLNEVSLYANMQGAIRLVGKDVHACHFHT